LRFLADAGISKRIVEWLRTQAHDAMHLREQGLQRLPDREVFAKASAERRVVLTFDLDYGEIVALSPSPAASVILFRLHDTSTPHVIERLEAVLKVSSPQLEQGGVVVAVEETRHRVRAFPRKPQAPE
jgi:predicted nuclease of predicted toxin-antitoxin system